MYPLPKPPGSETITPPIVEEIIKGIACLPLEDKRMLDIGSGAARGSRLAAWYFEATTLSLLDPKQEPNPYPAWYSPPWEEFHLTIPVDSDEFIARFAEGVGIITSFVSFHEFERPRDALRNMFRVCDLHRGGCIIIIDWHPDFISRSAMGAQGKIKQHYTTDRARLGRLGLITTTAQRALYREVGSEFDVSPDHILWQTFGRELTVTIISQLD